MEPNGRQTELPGGREEAPKERKIGKSVQHAAVAPNMQDASRECSNGDTSELLNGERAHSGQAATSVDEPNGSSLLAYRTWPSSRFLKAVAGHRPDSTEGSGVGRSAECHVLGAPANLIARALTQEAPHRSSSHNSPSSTPPSEAEENQMTCRQTRRGEL